MSRWSKWLFWIAGVLVVLVVAGMLLVKLLITPERVRTTVEAWAAEAVQRKVELQQIDIGLFSGVQLEGLKLLSRDGSVEFCSHRDLGGGRNVHDDGAGRRSKSVFSTSERLGDLRRVRWRRNAAMAKRPSC